MNIVSRTCRPLADGRWGERQPLAHFRSESAYVLLGDPGIGKTKSLEQEACIEGCEVTSASDFLEGEPPDEFPQPLFIDGLDEVRAGASGRPSVAGAIRIRLQTLGMPRFRLSCRAADWLGAVDVHRLEQVAPGGQLKVLLLESLDEAGVRAILENHELIAEEFIQEAGERGVAELLHNPQTLKMLVRVVTTGGAWPQGLQETFQAACSLMSDEHSREHRAAGGHFRRAEILLDAGRLCVLQLICGLDGVALDTDDASPLYPLVDDLGDADTDALRASLSRRLFASTGRGRLIPIHRRVAEFLGARYLGQRVDQDLSARRVVALMTGEDGRVVAPLRGLAAWLAAQCPAARRFAIKSDPVGVGLYGDIRNFSQDDKRLLIDVLAREAPSSLPYGVVDSGAFAPLATCRNWAKDVYAIRITRFLASCCMNSIRRSSRRGRYFGTGSMARAGTTSPTTRISGTACCPRRRARLTLPSCSTAWSNGTPASVMKPILRFPASPLVLSVERLSNYLLTVDAFTGG